MERWSCGFWVERFLVRMKEGRKEGIECDLDESSKVGKIGVH